MVQLTIEQRVFVVLHYTKTQSIAAVQNAFLERFPDRNPPCKGLIPRALFLGEMRIISPVSFELRLLE